MMQLTEILPVGIVKLLVSV